ncbi:MAG: hypothetical protein GX325_09475 [Peptococcaceae bacterium]|nr:hypothetical protein [Peptococcaceae bacterium]
MTTKTCEECPVKDLQRVKDLLEKKVLSKMPEDVRGPLLEAKKQMKLVVRGLVEHALQEEAKTDERPKEPRQIQLDD